MNDKVELKGSLYMLMHTAVVYVQHVHVQLLHHQFTGWRVDSQLLYYNVSRDEPILLFSHLFFSLAILSSLAYYAQYFARSCNILLQV